MTYFKLKKLLPFIDQLKHYFVKKIQKEYFAVVLIDSKLLKACVWEKSGSDFAIVGVAEEPFVGTTENMIDSADRAISKAQVNVESSQVKNVIFAVSPNWIEKGKIQANYLKLLKNICAALSLKPMGFVVDVEAVVKELEQREKTKINMLLLQISKEMITAGVIEQSQINETVSSLRSESVGADFLSLLADLKATVLPNKIVLQDHAENLESIKQEILQLPLLSKEKRFLQFPLVEILPENFDVEAVVNTVAKEMGGEEKKPQCEVIKGPVKKVAASLPSPIDFVYDQDIRVLQREEMLRSGQSQLSIRKLFWPQVITVSFFLIMVGFLIYWWNFSTADLTLFVAKRDFADELNLTLVDQTKAAGQQDVLKGKEITVEVSGKMDFIATGKKKTGEKASGEVVIFNKTTDSAKTFDKGTVISANGVKFILKEAVTVDAATIKTENEAETKIFGKKNVPVEAEKFGQEYNLSDSYDWTIDSFSQSSYAAHNDTPLTGGTSREIVVVSENDQKNALKKLEAELLKQANSSIKKKIDSSTEDILPDFVSREAVKKIFSHEVDEETKNFSLELRMSFATYAYTKKDFQEKVAKKLQNKVPAGFFLDMSQLEFQLKDFEADSKNDQIKLNFNFSAQAIPKIPMAELRSSLVGTPLLQVDQKIKKISGVKSWQATIKPQLPLIFNTLPHQAQNIKIKLEY